MSQNTMDKQKTLFEQIVWYGVNCVKFFLLIILSQIPITILAIPSELQTLGVIRSVQEIHYLWLLELLIVASGIGIVWLFYFLYKKQLQKNSELPAYQEPLKRNRKWFFWFGIGLLGWLIVLAANVFVGHLSGDQTAENQEALISMYRLMPLSSAFCIALFAPISEEFLYRGIFFNYFFEKDVRWIRLAGVLVNGLFFMVLHDTTFSWVSIPYLLMGLLFAGIYRTSRDIRVSMTLHFINNLIGLIGIYSMF